MQKVCLNIYFKRVDTCLYDFNRWIDHIYSFRLVLYKFVTWFPYMQQFHCGLHWIIILACPISSGKWNVNFCHRIPETSSLLVPVVPLGVWRLENFRKAINRRRLQRFGFTSLFVNLVNHLTIYYTYFVTQCYNRWYDSMRLIAEQAKSQTFRYPLLRQFSSSVSVSFDFFKLILPWKCANI